MQMLLDNMIIPSPLNYIGGKYKLLPQLLPLFPKVKGTFIDLFCGGCNVGINVFSEKTVFNDTDANLIYLYNTFRNLDKDVLFDMIDEIIDKYSLSRSDINGYDYYNCESSGGLGIYNKEHFLKLREDFNENTKESLIKSGMQIAQSDFSSGCSKKPQAGWRLSRIFWAR